MIIGIECTAHTFGIGVAEKGKVLANLRDMYVPEKGGIVPMESANHHRKVSEKLWNGALEKAGISEKEIKAIALSNAPGLSPCLIAGLHFAKEKALKLGVPIVPVNHCIAHLEIGRSVGAHDPVLLYASGANTQIIAFAAGKYRIFGETLDIGVGNFIDKVARHFGMPFPGGPKMEIAAKTGKYNGNKVPEHFNSHELKYIELPYSIKGMDVSFSGMQTKLQQLFDKGEKVEDLAFSLQETAFPMLVEAAERALAHTGKTELVLGGGVACNSRLQEMCRIMCAERGAKFFCPERSLLVDNAGMIAYTGEIMLNAGIKKEAKDVDIAPRERTDEVIVTWR
jgi:glycoprotease/Kae1 family metallohydrolase